MEFDYQKFGLQVKEKRLIEGLTQHELSNKLFNSSSASIVVKVEKGKRVSLTTIVRFLKWLRKELTEYAKY